MAPEGKRTWQRGSCRRPSLITGRFVVVSLSLSLSLSRLVLFFFGKKKTKIGSTVAVWPYRVLPGSALAVVRFLQVDVVFIDLGPLWLFFSFFLVQLWPSHSIALLLLLLFCFCFFLILDCFHTLSRWPFARLRSIVGGSSLPARRSFVLFFASSELNIICIRLCDCQSVVLVSASIRFRWHCCVCVCVSVIFTQPIFFSILVCRPKVNRFVNRFRFFCFSGVLRWPVESAVDGHPETRKNSTKDQIKNGKSIDDSMAFLMFLLSYGVFTVFLWTPLKCSTPKVKQPNYSRLNSVKLGKTR